MAPINRTDDELVSDAAAWGRYETPELIRRLRSSVDALNATSTKQQEEMINLTRWIYRLTWVMAVVGIIQGVQIIVSFIKLKGGGT